MSKTTIKDNRVRLRPSKKLLELINEHKDSITELPDNIANILKLVGYDVKAKIELIKSEGALKKPQINMKLLAELQKNSSPKGDKEKAKKQQEQETAEKNGKQEDENQLKADVYLYLPDLIWLNAWLAQLRKQKGIDVFLHNVIETCSLDLPKNEEIPRDPVLEERCKRLREEQQNRDYMKMTKNVDASLKYIPEDTIAFQMKTLNSQIIAVLQFVFSVIAGFVFGFLGIELIIGNLDFGLRLLLGIMCALIIALAEIYFLAKKLNEYETAITELNQQCTPVKSKKPHAD